MNRPLLILCIALAGCGELLSTPARAEGLFADFSTSMGDFTVRLDEERAPRAVANFIGLATGDRDWLDPELGVPVARPFYEGTRIHGIIRWATSPGITNTWGIRGGLRPVRGAIGATTYSGPPGYSILQEITNGLAHSNGVIAMVNTGPHSAGSEFILATDDAPFWDGAHTVFGNVVSNAAVLQAMAAVAADPESGAPLTPITVSNVIIRRVGAAAEAFDIHAYSLPMPTQTVSNLEIAQSTNAALSYAVPGQSEYFVVHATNMLMASWQIDPNGFNDQPGSVGITNTFVTTPFGPVHFFHVSQVHYPEFTATTPGSPYYFAAEWSSGDVYHYVLDIAAKTGTWALVEAGSNVVSSSGALNDVMWRTKTAYSIEFFFWDFLGNDLYYTLGFDEPGATSGRYYLDAYGWFGDYLGFERGPYDTAGVPPMATSLGTPAPAGLSARDSDGAARPERTRGWPPPSEPDPVQAMREPGIRFSPPRPPP